MEKPDTKVKKRKWIFHSLTMCHYPTCVYIYTYIYIYIYSMSMGIGASGRLYTVYPLLQV